MACFKTRPVPLIARKRKRAPKRKDKRKGKCSRWYRKCWSCETRFSVPAKDKYRLAKYYVCSDCRGPETPELYSWPVSDVERAYLLEKHGGKCEICGTTDKLVIDHDHETGVVRGILCRRHNMGLGYFKDSPELLKAASNYIESHYGNVQKWEEAFGNAA